MVLVKYSLLTTLLLGLGTYSTAVSYVDMLCQADGLPDPINSYLINPDNCEMYTSCKDNCGQVKKLNGNNAQMRCSCDALCITFNDCCRDIQSECPLQYTQALHTMDHYEHSWDGMDSTCARIVELGDPIPLISECQYDSEACIVRQGDKFDRIPVLDLDTGVDFINARCAICNGVARGEIWSSTVYCRDQQELPNRNGSTNSTIVRTEDVLNSVQNGGCSFEIDWPEPRAWPLRICTNTALKNTCDEGCDNIELRQACTNNSDNIVFDQWFNNYANPYCALCGSLADTESGLECGLKVFVFEGMRVPSFSFAVLFRFDASSDNGVALRGDKVECPADQVYVSETIGCRDVIRHINCPIGYIWTPPSCMMDDRLEEVILIEVNFSLERHTNISLVESAVVLYESIICARLNHTILDIFENVTSLQCNTNSTVFPDETWINVTVSVLWNSNESLNSSTQSNKSVQYFIEETAYNSTYVFVDLLNSGAIFNFSVNGRTHAPDRVNLECALVAFYENEYKLTENASVKIVSTGQKIDDSKVIIRNAVLYVCKDTLTIDDSRRIANDTEDLILTILTLIFMILSAMFLVTRIVLQFIVPVFKAFPLQLQFYYCIALLASVVIFLLSPLFRVDTHACRTVGILMHYTFLAAFAWMTVIAIDMYIMLSSFSGMQRATERTGFKDMIVQQIAAWGLPACVVTISLIVDYTPPDKHNLKPDYGEHRCWLSSETYAILVFFGIPIFIAVILNTILFILVALKLRKAFDRRSRMTNENQSNWSTYLRLFIIMGVGCGFLILTPFIDHIALWILIIITSASQGIYIGAVSIFNKEVLKYIRNKICSKYAEEKTSEKPTTDTNLKFSQSKPLEMSHHMDSQEDLSAEQVVHVELNELNIDDQATVVAIAAPTVPTNGSPVTSEHDILLARKASAR